MFVEPHTGNDKVGWIEVVCGSMFSGKTEELIRRLKRAVIAGKSVEIFKPHIDNRFHKADVVSHDKRSITSTPVSNAQNILVLASGHDVVGIDEAQFFDEELPDVCNRLARQGTRVIVAGLDMDYAGNPFGTMPQLLSIAEYVTKLHAICVQCGAPAQYSYRLTSSSQQIELGEQDVYEPRCRSCFYH
jgi:thymidine kinase